MVVDPEGGVELTEQDALVLLTVASVQLPALKPAEPDELKTTWPVGVLAPLVAVSVMVALQLDAELASTGFGVQETEALVGSIGSGAPLSCSISVWKGCPPPVTCPAASQVPPLQLTAARSLLPPLLGSALATTLQDAPS